jgi:hypothetical protein
MMVKILWYVYMILHALFSYKIFRWAIFFLKKINNLDYSLDQSNKLLLFESNKKKAKIEKRLKKQPQ